ncbi:hypothetical protein ACVGOW_21455 [Pseudonocardia saturnea]
MFAGRPLGIGMAVVGIWPSFALAIDWTRYTAPWVALGVYLLSLAIIAGLWWLGARGIGPWTSVAAGIALGVLTVVLAWQIPAGQPFGAAAWLGSWGAAIPMLLGFSRPIEEPLAILSVLAASNVVAVVRADESGDAMHTASLHLGMPLAVTAAGLALVTALRRSAASARRSREQTEALARREQVSQTVERERTTRFAAWQARIAPLLEDVASGRLSAHDPDVGARCRAYAAAVRAELGVESESILSALLPATPGVAVVVRDLDVGHRLVAADRIALVRLVHDVCAGAEAGALQLTLLPDGEPGTPVTHALAILAADGLPAPLSHDGGTLTASPPRWWYDLRLRCEAAPAIAYATPPQDR